MDKVNINETGENFNFDDYCIHDCDNCPYFEIVDCQCLLNDMEWS